MLHNDEVFTELKIPAGRRPMTEGESRISALVGLTISLLFVAAILDEFSTRKLSIAFFLLFWIPMLVVHELGHALAAKLLGWRVREIVIGFGRTLWQGRFGETRIKIKLAPVEGYVLPVPNERSGIRIKSMLIYAAGPGAELLVLVLMLLVFGTEAVFGDSDSVAQVATKSLAVVILIGAGFNLLPFRTDGAVSDGLGILSSPFMPDEAIEMRLLTVEIREIQQRLENDDTAGALALAGDQLQRFPGNLWLNLAMAAALAADQQTEKARNLVRDRLLDDSQTDIVRRDWLKLQAQIELDSDETNSMVLDLALQKALAITPGAPDLLAIKGASLVLRGRNDDGGNLLAEAWRANDGSADDPLMLAYLAIAAKRQGDNEAFEHFRHAFAATNRSRSLARRVVALT